MFRTKAKGREYFYAWRGGPALPDPNIDPRAFAEAYARHAKARGSRARTVSVLIDDYLLSPEWTRLSRETQRVRGFRLARIRGRWGDLPLDLVGADGQRDDFITWRNTMAATPRAADEHIEMMNVLFNWALERERIRRNPAKGIKRLYASNRSEVIFSDDEIAVLTDRARPDLRRVIRGALYTGLRAGDLAELDWRDVDLGDGVIERATNKSRRAPVRAFMAILPPLRAVLEECSQGQAEPQGRVFLRGGSPWRAKQISDAFAYLSSRVLGIEKHFHDLRGNAATMLARAGVATQDIDAWMGWKPGKGEGMRRRYVSRREVALAIAARLRQNEEHNPPASH